MTRRRWIADEVSGNRAALVGTNARHLARVLRASIGQEFDIATGQEVRLGRIVSVDDDRVEFELGQLQQIPSARVIKLALAVFKFDRFEWAIEKCTELGVTEVIPLVVRRTDTHLAASAPKRWERWQRIAREASQQSRRVSPPVISGPLKLKHYLASEGAVNRIVLGEGEEKTMLRDIAGGRDPVAVAVGPEGGWAAEESQQFSESGWRSASLGDTILRAETAAIAGVAIITALSDPRT